MPMVISRSGEDLPKQTALSPEQRDALWAAVLRKWIEAHPEELSAMIAAPERVSA